MEYKIRTFQNEEGIFAEIISKNGVSICTADGLTEFKAIKEVCLVFTDIIDNFVKKLGG